MGRRTLAARLVSRVTLSRQAGPFHLGHRLVNRLCHRHLLFLPDLCWFMCIRAILVDTFAKEVEVAAIPLSSYLDHPEPDLTFLTMSITDKVGNSLMKFATAFWHNGGVAEFMDGLLPPAGVRMRARPAPRPTGASGSAPMNAATGHISISWIAQSSTNCPTVSPNQDLGRMSPSSHFSHAMKTCRAS